MSKKMIDLAQFTCLFGQSELDEQFVHSYFEYCREKIIDALIRDGKATELANTLTTRINRCQPWKAELGNAMELFTKGNIGPSAAQLILASDVIPLELAASCPNEVKLLVNGWMVPISRAVQIRKSTSEIEVASESGQYSIARQHEVICSYPQRKQADESKSPKVVRFIDMSKGRGEVFPSVATDIDTVDSIGDSGIPAHVQKKELAEAINLLPNLSEFVLRSAAFIIAVPLKDGICPVEKNWPGVVLIESGLDAVSTLEELIEEICRQQMIKILYCDAVVNGPKEEVHYMPLRRLYLTTRRIFSELLQHMHVLHVLERLSEANWHQKETRVRAKEISLILRTEVFPAIAKSRSLTHAARTLAVRLNDSFSAASLL